jgi:hypothetical protein
MSEQNALVSAGGAQATSSEHTPLQVPTNMRSCTHILEIETSSSIFPAKLAQLSYPVNLHQQ